MNRRELIKKAAFATAAFAWSRELFATEHHFTDISPSTIILQSNENPYGPCAAAKKAMISAIETTNRYQWGETRKLATAIAQQHHLSEKHVLIGAGSSELLGLVSLLASFSGDQIVAPDPTFRIWTVAAEQMGLHVQWVPVTSTKDTDLQRMEETISPTTSMVYLCNPNNPTGIPIPQQDLRDFIQRVPSNILVLMDEAYTEFEDIPSTCDMIADYPNLVIAKTFSKVYGLAGARVGYLLAHPDTIDTLGNLQPWRNAGASAASIAGALASIQDPAFVEFCKNKNARCRKLFFDILDDLGMAYTPSVTSFAYFDTQNYRGDLGEQLKKHNIVGARSFEQDSTWRRLSIGTEDEMLAVGKALKI